MPFSRAGQLAIVLIMLSAISSVTVAATSKIYWSLDEGANLALQRADTDGSNIQDVIPGATHWANVDPVARKLYWIDEIAFGDVKRSNLDGSATETVVDFDSDGGPLAVGAGSIYLTRSFFEGCIGTWRYATDGSSEEFILPGVCPWGIAVDASDEKIYWTDPGTAEIWRAELDGANPTVILQTDPTPVGIALDLGQGKMYWTLRDGPISRADLNGSNVETLVDNDDYKAGIALDLKNGKLYWALEFGGQIMRADLDGSNPETFLEVSTLNIAIDPVASNGDVPAASSRGLFGLVIAMMVLLVAMPAVIRKRQGQLDTQV